MVKIRIVAVGKIKEKYYKDAVLEYSKRLSRFCDFEIIEVGEENYQKVDDGLISAIKEKECAKILPHLKGHIIATAIEGKKYGSQEFSKKIKNIIDGGNGVITFVIGGSYGLSQKVKQRSNELISFSDMTFPHTFFRVMLAEQIYRAFCIDGGIAYHK